MIFKDCKSLMSSLDRLRFLILLSAKRLTALNDALACHLQDSCITSFDRSVGPRRLRLGIVKIVSLKLIFLCINQKLLSHLENLPLSKTQVRFGDFCDEGRLEIANLLFHSRITLRLIVDWAKHPRLLNKT